jgi:hypothetical protein
MVPLDDHFAPEHTDGALAIRHLGAEKRVGRWADNSSEQSGRAVNAVDARFIQIAELKAPRRSSVLRLLAY